MRPKALPSVYLYLTPSRALPSVYPYLTPSSTLQNNHLGISAVYPYLTTSRTSQNNNFAPSFKCQLYHVHEYELRELWAEVRSGNRTI